MSFSSQSLTGFLISSLNQCGPKSKWRMKAKWRFLVAAVLVFIVYVSYKILEPVLREDPYLDSWNKQPFEPDGSSLELPRGKQVSKEQVIHSMIQRYKPNYTYMLDESPWDVAARWVTDRQVHKENAPELGAILNEMAHAKIIKADVGTKGTQLKLTLVLSGGQTVVFKPAWYERSDVITGTPYSGRDRHNAEIAAFHLGRILEFRRTPLAIGRRVDIHADIQPVATEQLLATFFEQDDKTCFYGKCLYCKGPEDGVCARTDGIMEGTIILWLPQSFKLKLHKHPWSRTYKEGKDARWMSDQYYCDKVRGVPKYSSGPIILDIIDTCVFDYLIGNADRHHYETFEGLENSMLLILDNGKSFGNPHHDEMTILAPLYQCCQIRISTWQRLLALQDKVLSRVLEGVMAADPIAPVLSKEHLEAMDRRLATILEQVKKCIDKVGNLAIVSDER